MRTIKFALKHDTDGYLYNDEDRPGGYTYDHEIDEFTVLYDKWEDALFQADINNETIVVVRKDAGGKWREDGIVG